MNTNNYNKTCRQWQYITIQPTIKEGDDEERECEELQTILRKEKLIYGKITKNIYSVAEGCTDTICCSFFMIKKENYLIKVQNNEHHGCRENGREFSLSTNRFNQQRFIKNNINKLLNNICISYRLNTCYSGIAFLFYDFHFFLLYN